MTSLGYVWNPEVLFHNTATLGKNLADGTKLLQSNDNNDDNGASYWLPILI